MQATIGSILLVIGMIALITQPLLGVIVVAFGYWMLETCAADHQQATGDAFVGMAVVCIAADFLISLGAHT